jgi:peroxiredoxin
MNYFLVVGSLLGFILLASLSLLGWQLLRQNGRILLRLDELEKRLNELEFGGDEPAGLPLDSLAPDFDLPDLTGERKTLAQYRGQTALLIFFNPACGFCRELLPKLVALNNPTSNGEPHSEQPSPQLLIISTGDVEANRKLFSEHKVYPVLLQKDMEVATAYRANGTPTGYLYPVLLQKDMEVATAYRANGTPTGYLINSEGKIASELAVGAEALLVLAKGVNGTERASRFSNRSLAHSKIKRDGLKAGTQAPDFRLPRLDGGELSLSELRGQRLLLVFSSPNCAPCNTLAPKLEKFHRKHPNLKMVMVSRDEPNENRAKVKEFNLTFPVVLQQQWEISRLYAMFATPMAYLIDKTGVIAYDVAVGVEPIVKLLSEIANKTALNH